MVRALRRSLPLVLALGASVALTSSGRAAGSASGGGVPRILERYLALGDPDPTQFRALRHIDAYNENFDKSAWMDVWTEADEQGFRYRIVSEGGSGWIRSKVFRAALESERKMWADGTPARAAITPANYEFVDRGGQPDGLESLLVKPRRKDTLLIEGSIFLNPADGDLVRLEGRLVKTPSFWTRRVDIVRWYRRFAGIRMPVALESTANVLIAGKSTFRLTYEYESVNGQRMGSPQPRLRQANIGKP
jgi:hypothetical protein